MIKRTFKLKDKNGFTDNIITTRNGYIEISDSTGDLVCFDPVEVQNLIKILDKPM